MGLFSPGKRNQLLAILERERGKYSVLFQIKKKEEIRNVIRVIFSFINYLESLIKNYYKTDFIISKRDRSYKVKIFQDSIAEIEKHITSIVHYGRACNLDGREIYNRWRGRIIKSINIEGLNEGHVINFIRNIAQLFSYIHGELQRK